jgi:hypothetical protein
MGAIALASNPIYHSRTKHVEVDYHFICEKVLHKDIAINYISTHDQHADIFTKGLTSACFLFLCDKLMVVAPPIRLRGAVKIAVLAVQGVTGHGTPAVQYAPDHDHAVQGTSNPACNSLPYTGSNQQSSDYAITPKSVHSQSRVSLTYNHAISNNILPTSIYSLTWPTVIYCLNISLPFPFVNIVLFPCISFTCCTESATL